MRIYLHQRFFQLGKIRISKTIYLQLCCLSFFLSAYQLDQISENVKVTIISLITSMVKIITGISFKVSNDFKNYSFQADKLKPGDKIARILTILKIEIINGMEGPN